MMNSQLFSGKRTGILIVLAFLLYPMYSCDKDNDDDEREEGVSPDHLHDSIE